MTLRYLLLFASILLCSGSCSDRSHIRPAAVAGLLERADSLLATRPDSALSLLRRIPSGHITRKAHLARHALLHTRALDKNYIDLVTDSILAPALSYYEKRGNFREKALAWYYQGRIYENAERTDSAIRALLRAEQYIVKTDDPETAGRVHYALGVQYARQYNLNQAVRHYAKALSIYRDSGQYRYYAGRTFGALGKTYYLKKENDSALYCFRQARKLFMQIDSADRTLQANSAVASIALQHSPAEARNILQDGYGRFGISSVPDFDYALWGRIFQRENQYDSAVYWYTRQYRSATLPDKRRAAVLILLEKIAQERNRPDEALQYSKMYIRLQDSINRQEKEQLIRRAERQYAAEQLRRSVDKLRIRNRYERLSFLLVGFLTLLFTGIVVHDILRKKREVIRQQEQEIDSCKQLIEELRDYRDDLQEQYRKLKQLSERHDTNEEHFVRLLEMRIQGLQSLMDEAYTSENVPARFFAKFKEYVTAFPVTKETLFEVRHIADKQYGGIIEYLARTYPELSQADLDLCSMICLGFSLNSIRFLYNHNNIESLYNKRSRLRNKLGLAIGTNLDAYLRDLAVSAERPQNR